MRKAPSTEIVTTGEIKGVNRGAELRFLFYFFLSVRYVAMWHKYRQLLRKDKYEYTRQDLTPIFTPLGKINMI